MCSRVEAGRPIKDLGTRSKKPLVRGWHSAGTPAGEKVMT